MRTPNPYEILNTCTLKYTHIYSHWHTLIFSKHIYLNDQVLTSYKKFRKEFECKTNCFCAGINNYATKGRTQEMHRIIYLPGYNIAMGL